MKVMTMTLVLGLLLSAAPVLRAAETAGGDRLINGKQPGQTFDFKPYLVKGKMNIVDFYSEYCPPCRAVMPRLQALAAKDHDIVVLRVDINRPNVQGIDWGSPVARQYGLQFVPNFMVYDAGGKLVAQGKEGSDMVYTVLDRHGL